MRRRVERLTPPAELPVTLEHARAHLRVTHAMDDTYIAELIAAAARHVEDVTSCRLLSVRVRVTFPCFAPRIPLDFPQVGDVFSVRYTDATGADVLVPANDYRVVRSVDTYIVPELEKSWPTTHPLDASVRVEMTAPGFGERWEHVPEALRQAILLLVGHWYTTRQAVSTGQPPVEVPLAFDSLIAPYRLMRIG